MKQKRMLFWRRTRRGARQTLCAAALVLAGRAVLRGQGLRMTLQLLLLGRFGPELPCAAGCLLLAALFLAAERFARHTPAGRHFARRPLCDVSLPEAPLCGGAAALAVGTARQAASAGQTDADESGPADWQVILPVILEETLHSACAVLRRAGRQGRERAADAFAGQARRSDPLAREQTEVSVNTRTLFESGASVRHRTATRRGPNKVCTAGFRRGEQALLWGAPPGMAAFCAKACAGAGKGRPGAARGHPKRGVLRKNTVLRFLNGTQAV